mmetsp:Transcript_7974/g.11829  ORF Transcript_7974/g.11829 Transcript_7974/m.11829 type:complete len:230 (-) Transcript_7974:392-1081(-)
MRSCCGIWSVYNLIINFNNSLMLMIRLMIHIESSSGCGFGIFYYRHLGSWLGILLFINTLSSIIHSSSTIIIIFIIIVCARVIGRGGVAVIRIITGCIHIMIIFMFYHSFCFLPFLLLMVMNMTPILFFLAHICILLPLLRMLNQFIKAIFALLIKLCITAPHSTRCCSRTSFLLPLLHTLYIARCPIPPSFLFLIIYLILPPHDLSDQLFIRSWICSITVRIVKRNKG